VFNFDAFRTTPKVL
jgi:hypothetical protein